MDSSYQELHFRKIKGYKEIEKFLSNYLANKKVIDENFTEMNISISA